MNAGQIIGRAAYDCGDEEFHFIRKDEYLRMLNRVYRYFTENTLILRNIVGFLTVSGTKEYLLYGTDSLGNIYGDNFLGFYRVEYNGVKCYERDLDSLLNQGSINTLDGPDTTDPHEIVYAMDYLGEYLRMIFIHDPATNDEVILYYYEQPRIGVINSVNYSLKIHPSYQEDLVIGVEALANKRLAKLALLSKKGLKPDASKVFNSEYIVARNDFFARVMRVKGKVANFKDDTIPLQMSIAGSAFSVSMGDDGDMDIIDLSDA